MNVIKKEYSLDALPLLVQDLFALRQDCKIYTFTGELGAGKTTLVKALLKEFGVQEVITSPTFSYVNVYQNNKNELLYHFDLYRLSSLDEFLEAGFDEFLYLQNSWAFIEWPEIITPLLRTAVCQIVIEYDTESLDRRIVTYKVIR